MIRSSAAEHVLVQQIADRQIFRMIADRHHRHDLAPVQEQGQRPFGDDRGLDRLAVLIDSGNPPGQARIVGVGPYREFLHAPMMGRRGPGSARWRARRASRLHG